MEEYEGPYGGTSYILENINELESIPKDAQQLVTDKTCNLFKQSIKDQVRFISSTYPTIPEYIKLFLNDLSKAKKCTLEVHMTEYASKMIYLRYYFNDEWQFGLSFDFTKDETMPEFIPEPLQNVYNILGEINLNGYGSAGGLLYPPDAHPSIGKWCGEEFIENQYSNDYAAFYQCSTSDYLLYNKENKDAKTAWYVHDDSDQTGDYKDIDNTLRDMFKAFTEHKEFSAY